MSKIDNKAIASIKVLALDMIDKSKSGHPGIVLSAAPIIYALYKDCINAIPGKPDWINRDRFVLSAGHGSALLYSMLYHAGFDIDIEELKHYRELNSLTPGHPEVHVTSGVDVSTGLLGEGIANAVGMAWAERYLRSLVDKEKPKSKLIDYYTYCLCSDGDLQEGVAYEALSFASTQRLNKLILLYDCNKISLDGEVDLTYTEDIEIRFEALDFNVIRVKKGNNYEDISDAIESAKKSKKPSLIIIETVLGKDSIYENTNKVHGQPLEKEDLKHIKDKLKYTNEPFAIDETILKSLQSEINTRVNKKYQKWLDEYNTITVGNNKKLNSLIRLLEKGELAIDFDDSNFKISENYDEAIRDSNNKILNFISPKTPFFLGGSADLASSCKTLLRNTSINSVDEPTGKNIFFGLREHAMGGILNGIALSNIRVFASTFLVFSDYMKPSIRMSAMMNLPVTYIFTHDSFYVGQDGPTYQPVEQLTMLRTIPDLITFRPADINEIIGAWEFILRNNCTSSLIISKEKRQRYKNTNAKFVKYGAYMIRKEKYHLDGVIIATGSEVQMALEIAHELYTAGHDIRVVSMPSMSLFLKQNPKYEEQLLPKNVPTFVIEAGDDLIWNRFATKPEYIFGINKFGQSARAEELEKYYKFDKETILERINSYLEKTIDIDII